MLQLESVTKRYGDLEALHELSLSVRDGEIFGFVGANGAGKTTTMRVVLGVLEADCRQRSLERRPRSPSRCGAGSVTSPRTEACTRR